MKQNRAQLDQLLKSNKILEERAEDAKGISRRNNVRVTGVPEGEEGANMEAFLERWFTDLFGKESFSPFLAMEIGEIGELGLAKMAITFIDTC